MRRKLSTIPQFAVFHILWIIWWITLGTMCEIYLRPFENPFIFKTSRCVYDVE